MFPLISRAIPLAASLSLLWSADVPAQRTWTVDCAAGSSADFHDIQAAIDAAGAGDRIEVRGAGPYQPFVVSRGLDLVAVDRALVPYFGVVGAPAGTAIRISGFRCQPRPSWSEPDAVVQVRGCAGSVLLTDLVVWCRSPDPVGGFVIRDAANVAVQDCSLTGRSAGQARGGPAILVERAQLTLQRTMAIGGSGGTTETGSVAYDGGPGLAVLGASSVQIADSTVVGGDAGYGLFIGAYGGEGIVAEPAVRIRVARSVVGGGAGESPGAAARGPVAVTADCALTGALRGGATVIRAQTMLRTTPTVARGGAILVTVDGPPDTLFALCFDVHHAHIRAPGLDDALLLTPSCVTVGTAELNAAGWRISLPVPDEPALRHACVFLQGVALEPAGRLTLTSLGVSRID